MAELPNNYERQFSLVLALVASSAGLRKSEILTTVHGYSQRYKDSAKASLASLRFCGRGLNVTRRASAEPNESITRACWV